MFKFNKINNKAVFTFEPKLDTAKCNGKENDVIAILGGEKKEVVFDMTGVEYISSYFLRICTVVAKEVGSVNLKVINSSPNVKKVFKIAGFDHLMSIA
ncbi:MAG: STAS domain-containing protein [Ignavibacteriaceae bacterium]